MLPEFGLRYRFQPTEFAGQPAHQRDAGRRAMRLLELRPDDRVGDLFCGLGNFTLPIAQRAAFTYGIEGSAPLIARARENAAKRAGRSWTLPWPTFEIADDWFDTLPQLNKLLIDPPRDGALKR